jgi:hypothetical protein
MLFSIFLFITSAWAGKPSDVLLNPKSTEVEISLALDEIRSAPDFDPTYAEALIRFLDTSKSEELRWQAAEKLYLHCHYKRGQFKVVVPTLIKTDFLLSVERLMVFDSNPVVRVFAARLGQILLGSFDDSPDTQDLRSKLVDAYLPVLLLAFRHPSVELRIEVQSALDNISDTNAFRKSKYAKQTLAKMLVYAKKHPEPDYDDYATVIADWLSKIKDPQLPRPR